LSPNIVEEIVDDVLVHKELKSDCLNFISTLEVITVDIVKSVLSEVNIHAESPTVFQDVFNVKKIKGKYDVKVQGADGQFVIFKEDQNLYRRPRFTDRYVGEWFIVGDDYLGKITKIINYDTIEVSPHGNTNILTEPTIFKCTDSDVKHYSYMYDNEYGTNDYGFGKAKSTSERKPVGGTSVSDILKRLEIANKEEEEEEIQG
jgi:hypothetical protein